uniref:Uncharacterized protein n=1 Tax=Anguilla anguilla TaxID=7936 RepID=A0A0E9PP38_ANGAN
MNLKIRNNNSYKKHCNLLQISTVIKLIYFSLQSTDILYSNYIICRSCHTTLYSCT